MYKRVKNDTYFKYFLTKPLLYPKLIDALFKILNSFIVNRIRKKTNFLSSLKYNNKTRQEILNKITRIKNITIIDKNAIDLPILNFKIKGRYFDLKKIRIPLASCSESFEYNIFDKKYKDKEDYFAANRFIWLYEILHTYPYENVLNSAFEMIANWIKSNSYPSKDLKFESYSISERIIAWLFFLLFTKRYMRISEDLFINIMSSIELQLNHLIHNLEYRGSRTNNHILNNARALYIAGRILNIEEASTLGENIFKDEYDSIIKDGIYQEGSSHYQFLLTKNLIETHLIAYLTKDSKNKEFFDSLVTKLVEVSGDLQSKFKTKDLPLVGDISPDMSPVWFLGYPFTKKNKYHSIWFDLFNYDPYKFISIKNNNIENYAIEETKSRWYYLNYKDIEIWVFTRNEKIQCHGHNDNGSIIVFFKGKPIIIDLGLSDYMNKLKSKQQIDCTSHNIPVINNYCPDISKCSILYSFINIASSCKINYYSDNEIKYSIIYANKRIRVDRCILVNQNHIVITDEIRSYCNFTIYEINWHLNDLVMKNCNHIFYAKDKYNIVIKSNNELSTKVGKEYTKSKKYGSKDQRVSTINIHTKSNKAINISVILSFK